MGVDMKYISNIGKYIDKLTKTKKRNLLAASEFARNELIKKLSGYRSGQTYLVPGTNTTYTASAPGEAPASRTGQLKGSIEYTVGKDKARIGTPLEYGMELELGLKPGVAKRPWLEVTLKDNNKQIQDKLKAGW